MLNGNCEFTTMDGVKHLETRYGGRKPSHRYSDAEIMSKFWFNCANCLNREWKKVAFQTYAVKYCVPIIDGICPVGDCIYDLLITAVIDHNKSKDNIRFVILPHYKQNNQK